MSERETLLILEKYELMDGHRNLKPGQRILSPRQESLLEGAIEGLKKNVGIPAGMFGPVLRYIVLGHTPGGFLTSVITNDLRGAIHQSDSENSKALSEWVNFFHWHAPAQCCGSLERMESWIRERRIMGDDGVLDQGAPEKKHAVDSIAWDTFSS